MTAPSTWVMGQMFHKRYDTAAGADIALIRSRAARAAGVPTPAAQPGPDPNVLVFDRIVSQGTVALPALLLPLVRLSAMPGAGLPRFDPFLRIAPRLPGAPDPVRARIAALQAADRALDWPDHGVVHGDFHPGQVLCDANGTAWVIDLDDLARGPVEADLGNLAAWHSTQQPGHLPSQMDDCRRRVLAGWAAVSGPADPDLMAHFCAIAVLRRALKLGARGQLWVLDQLCLMP